MECKLGNYSEYVQKSVRFNRYIVECKYAIGEKISPALNDLIDT